MLRTFIRENSVQSNTFAMVFPGQGSQKVGMMTAMANRFDVVTSTFKEASEVLGYDLWELATHGPEAQLNDTLYTQPLMLASDVAMWRSWLHLGGRYPALMAGHSLGEFCLLYPSAAAAAS